MLTLKDIASSRQAKAQTAWKPANTKGQQRMKHAALQNDEMGIDYDSRKLELQSVLDQIGPPRASKMQLKETIASRGWSIDTAAIWLGIGRQHLYSILNNPRRPRHWEIALLNLPEVGHSAIRRIRDANKASSAPTQFAKKIHQQQALTEPEFGKFWTATQCIEGIAEEGETVTVHTLSPGLLRVRNEQTGTEENIPLQLLLDNFADTGRIT